MQRAVLLKGGLVGRSLGFRIDVCLRILEHVSEFAMTYVCVHSAVCIRYYAVCKRTQYCDVYVYYYAVCIRVLL